MGGLGHAAEVTASEASGAGVGFAQVDHPLGRVGPVAVCQQFVRALEQFVKVSDQAMRTRQRAIPLCDEFVSRGGRFVHGTGGFSHQSRYETGFSPTVRGIYPQVRSYSVN